MGRKKHRSAAPQVYEMGDERIAYPSAPPLPPPMYPSQHVIDASFAPPPFHAAHHVQPATVNHSTDQIARFNVVKTHRLAKRHNPQLYTERKCTDVFCCFLFLVFIAGWMVIAGFGLMWGDPQRLIYPTDLQFRRCGSYVENGYNFTDKPFLFYFDLTKCLSYATALGGCQTTQICVKECPQQYFSYLQLRKASTAEIQRTLASTVYCTDDVDKKSVTTFQQLQSLVLNGKCVSYTVKSVPVLQRCFPEAIFKSANTLNNALNVNNSLDYLRTAFGDDAMIPQDSNVASQSTEVMKQVMDDQPVLSKVVHDVSTSWWQMLVLIAAAGVFAFLWTVVMRLLGSLIIWLSILIVISALSLGSAYSWMQWNDLKASGAIDDYSFHPTIDAYFEMPTTWLVVAISTSVVLVVVLLVFIFIRKRISIACALIEESSRAIGSMMSTLLFPLFPFVLHLCVFALWGSISVWLASSGQEVCRMRDAMGAVNNSSMRCDCEKKIVGCTYVGVEKPSDTVFWLQAYNLFGFFWLSCFVTALGDIALAGAFASFYWARDKNKDLPTFPVMRALKRAVRYNLGSIAFGSLIIAIVKMIRVMLEYIDNKFGKSENRVIKYILMCLKCCFWCLEVFFKFLTKNAYIMIAIYGRNFFKSAKDSFMLISRNIVRTVVVHKVAGILLFLGKAMITAGMGILSFYYFTGRWEVDGIPRVDVYYYFVPIIIVVVGSYFMADLFFDVYEMSVDTTFICFLEDSEQNDGSPERPFYMSQKLLSILGNKNDIALVAK